MRTRQIQRLFFTDNSSSRAKLSATMRVLERLSNFGLVDHLPRAIGGNGRGSEGKIWHLTEAGLRLLDLGAVKEKKRTRYLEPSTSFLRHTIAISEAFVQVTEICRMSEAMSLSHIDVEPECWRAFQKNGKTVSLRPDLYAETISGKFEYHWFIEMDLATEDIPTILEKCFRYEEYYQTRAEQNTEGIFPYVLWIVPDEERKRKISEALAKDVGRHCVKLNIVITPNRLWTILTEGVKADDLC